jgi:hypothetical protein
MARYISIQLFIAKMLSALKYVFRYFYQSIFVRMWNYRTPRSNVFFEKLIVPELSKIFSEFNGKRRLDVKLYFD